MRSTLAESAMTFPPRHRRDDPISLLAVAAFVSEYHGLSMTGRSNLWHLPKPAADHSSPTGVRRSSRAAKLRLSERDGKHDRLSQRQYRASRAGNPRCNAARQYRHGARLWRRRVDGPAAEPLR